mmetsp:Transcript_11590/g.19864  ORF Transcript_11590/g.19864 Transcript_11590/m.19864 type:complete len:246 (-) Transcript_11590:244-981(-)
MDGSDEVDDEASESDTNSMDDVHRNMIYSAHIDDEMFVIKALNYGADIDFPSYLGETPLHIACRNGNVRLVCLLLDRGAKVDLKDTAGNTPFHLSCCRQEMDIAKLLLRRGAELYSVTASGWTSLIASACNGWMDITNMLLEESKARSENAGLLVSNQTHSEYINHRTNQGRTALHWACISERLEIIPLLLEHGADKNITDQFNKTALDYLVECVPRVLDLVSNPQPDSGENELLIKTYQMLSLG